MRKLCAAKVPCTAGCKYCFSKWNNYGLHHMVEEKIFDTASVVLYPCCDGDYFMQQDMIETIMSYTENYNQVLVSISSKVQPSSEELQRLYSLNDWLVSKGRGMVKYASSLSTMSMINELEPGTMDFEMRYKIAQEISQHAIPVSLTLKPIMPFVSGEEYCSIIQKYSKLTKSVLVGGLYVNKSTDFYRSYIDQKWDVEKRSVTWLPDNPTWDYVNVADQIDIIMKYCAERDIEVFESDDALFEYILKGRTI